MTGPSDTAAPKRTLSEVAEALQAGPFEHALRVAISSTGLTLARLEYHLEQRGLHIGRSTLSYWQQGRRQPERADSLQAVSALEEILGLPKDSLIQLLGPPKPRGRWLGHVPGSLDWTDLFEFAENVEQAVTAESRRQNNRLRETFTVDEFMIGPDRRKIWQDVTKVVRAREDGADRQLLVFYASADIDVSRIRVEKLSNCRIGRQRAVVSRNFVALEFLFDRVLVVGQSHFFGYRISFEGAAIGDLPAETALEEREMMRGFRYPISSYAMQAHFSAERLPVRCFAVYEERSGRETLDELTLTAQHTCHIALEDVVPGFHGLRWEWD